MRLFMLICLLSTSLLGQAQTPITLTRADFPCPSLLSCGLPDSVLYTNIPVGSNTINTTPTGAASSWMMNPLKNGSIAYQPFFPMSATPLIFQLAFLSCDYVQPLLGNAVGALPVTDAYEYYNYAGTGSSRLEIKGFGAYVTIPGQTTAIPLPAIYSSPDIVYQFPIAFGNSDSSVSGYSVTIPLGGTIGDITFKRNQKRVNSVDGWGSITTPAGTFDVLRVKSSINRVDSLITGIFPLGFPSKPVEYKWLGTGKRIPVFEVNGNLTGTNFTPTSIRHWGQGAPAGIFDAGLQHSIAIAPNPAFELSTLNYDLATESDVAIYLTDLSGATLAQFHFAKQAAGHHAETLPLHGLAPGTYLVKCLAGKEMISARLLKL